eukprot:g1672.t1
MSTPAYDDQNVFAKILRGELPSHKVYEDDKTLVIMDIMPRGDGHILVIPKAPSRNIFDIAPEDLNAVMATVQMMARTVVKAFGANGTTIQQFSEPAGRKDPGSTDLIGPGAVNADPKRARLFTFQRALILDLFDTSGLYVPTWDGIGAAGNLRLAYAYAASQLERRRLCDGTSPPVWTYEAPPEQLAHLAHMLLSEIELRSNDFVILELSVPEAMILRSSYSLWCDLFFNCLDTGQVADNGNWLNWQQATHNVDDTVQAILPHLRRDWIVSVTPLPDQA